MHTLDIYLRKLSEKCMLKQFDHRGTCSRTGYPLTRTLQSSVRNLCESC